MRIAFVTPIDPGQRGIGTAHRAAFWRRTLSTVGDVTTIVIPLLGDAPTHDGEPELGEFVTIDPFPLEHVRFPRLASAAPEYLGARWSTELADFDLIVGLRSYVGPFCVGLGSATRPPIVIDLDDDDVTYHSQRGEDDEAARYADLVESIRPHVVRMVSAQGFGDTVKVPNVVPSDAMTAEPRSSSRSVVAALRVVMVGNFSYVANVEGARWLLDEVWPLVIAQRPEAELVVAGLRSGELEHGVGYVEDLTELYDTASVALAPLLSGSGTRIKILEAWRFGVPVVSTPIGIDGLDAQHGEHALISADASMFASHIVRLLDDPSLRSHLAEMARHHVEQSFAPDVVAASVHALIERVTREPVGPMRRDDLSVSEVDDGLVVDDEAADVVHHLDPVSAIAFALCDGMTTGDQIAETIADVLGTSQEQASVQLYRALDQLVDARLVSDDPALPRATVGAAGRTFRLRPGTLDAAILDAVYSADEYDLPDQVPSGTTVIDVGAHIGAFSARLIDAGAERVIALEPQPDNRRIAAINLADEIDAGRVQLLGEAMWTASSGQSLVIGTAPEHSIDARNSTLNSGGHTVRIDDGSAELGEHRVRSIGLDELVEDARDSGGPVWVKMDCEGAEWAALEATGALGRIDVLVAEVHLGPDADETRFAALVDRLESAGLAVTVAVDASTDTLRRVAARRASGASS